MSFFDHGNLKMWPDFLLTWWQTKRIRQLKTVV